MTPSQRFMCEEIRKRMTEFYRCPENERRFERWKLSRQRGGASQPASIERAPQRSQMGPVPC